MATLKLSEAIRLGAMSTSPVHGPIFGSADGRICETCAIGAPMFALFGDAARAKVHRGNLNIIESIKVVMAERWPWVAGIKSFEYYTHAGATLVDTMIALFENREWTREQIADWVETIEPQTVAEDSAAPAVASQLVASRVETLTT